MGTIFKNPMTTMAAIDRLVHHSVILDMMSVESYRAEAANRQHLSSAPPKKLSSKQVTLGEVATSLRDSNASSTDPSHGPHTPASEHAPTAVLVGESRAEGPLIDGSQSAGLIVADGTI
jgi:hypothetical protein